MMYTKKTDAGYSSAISGIEQKTLVYGEHTLMCEFKLSQNSVLPRHSHPHEQTGYLVSGHIRIILESKTYDCHPGDSWCIPGDALHSAEILEDSIAVEVFSPVREDYLPLK